jgi:hypothetical protein
VSIDHVQNLDLPGLFDCPELRVLCQQVGEVNLAADPVLLVRLAKAPVCAI